MLGDFHVLREIGRGGMGVVYEAEQVSLGRRVALKVLEAHLTLQPEAVERFHREAAAAAGLRHPNILPVHFIGEEDGTHYFAMELVQGWPLERLLGELRAAGRPWFGAATPSPAAARAEPDGASELLRAWLEEAYRDPTACVCRLVEQVAAALEYGHERHILHRDVKSSNVLVQEDGTALLIDYGLARDLELPALTQPGQVVGSPYTLAPEQITADRDALDARVDVYALGVLLYELLTLCRPFDGQNAAEVLEKIRTREPVPPRRLRRGIPRDLETICLKALCKSRAGRYRTARAMQQDVERVRAGLPIRARPVGPLARAARAMRRHPLRGAAALVTSVAAATAAYFWLHRDAFLRVESEPPGAQVVLHDGETRRELGRAPLMQSLPPGRYTLEFELPGFPLAMRELELAGGESAEVEQRWPLSGLVVRCPQPGAVLSLFAGSRCRGPPRSVHPLPLAAPLVVPAGQYALRLSVPAHDAVSLEDTRALELAAGEQRVVSLWCSPVRTRFRVPLSEAVRALETGDFDGDGALEVLAVGERSLAVVDGGGEVLWEDRESDAIRAAALLDVDGDGTRDVLAGDIRGGVRGVTGAGAREERWQVRGAVESFVPAAPSSAGVQAFTDLGEVWELPAGGSAVRAAAVAAGAAAAAHAAAFTLQRERGTVTWCVPGGEELRRTELDEPLACSLHWDEAGVCLAVGTPSGRILGFDAEGNVLLEAAVDAPVLELAAVDLDGGGRTGLLVLADREWRVLRPDGQLRLRVPCTERLRALAPVDLDGDGRDEVLGATDGGVLLAWNLESERVFEWDLEDLDLVSVLHSPRDPGAQLLVQLSEPRGRVVDARGEVLWRGAVPASRRLLAGWFPEDAPPRLFLGGEAGLFALDVQSGGRWTQVLAGDVSALAPVGSAAAGDPVLVLATGEGSIVALDGRGVVLFDVGLQNHDAFPFLRVLDLEHDGAFEVLAASRRGALVVLRGNGSPMLRTRLPAGVVQACIAAGPERDTGVLLLENGELWSVRSGDLLQPVAVLPDALAIPTRVQGDPVLPVGCRAGLLRFLALDGAGQREVLLPGELLALECGDFDGDGRTDAAVATENHWLVLGDAGEHLLERRVTETGSRLWRWPDPDSPRDLLLATEGSRAVLLRARTDALPPPALPEPGTHLVSEE